jgi:hypothetical protein
MRAAQFEDSALHIIATIEPNARRRLKCWLDFAEPLPQSQRVWNDASDTRGISSGEQFSYGMRDSHVTHPAGARHESHGNGTRVSVSGWQSDVRVISEA